MKIKNPIDNLNATPAEKALIRRAGDLLLKFTLVTLVAGVIAMSIMNKHQPMIVPKIIGMDESQAQSALASKGLSMKVNRQQFDDRIPAGLVSSQVPRANAYVKRGQTI